MGPNVAENARHSPSLLRDRQAMTMSAGAGAANARGGRRRPSTSPPSSSASLRWGSGGFWGRGIGRGRGDRKLHSSSLRRLVVAARARAGGIRAGDNRTGGLALLAAALLLAVAGRLAARAAGFARGGLRGGIAASPPRLTCLPPSPGDGEEAGAVFCGTVPPPRSVLEPVADPSRVEALMEERHRRKRSARYDKLMREVPEERCEYQHAWQGTTYPACNGVHEAFLEGPHHYPQLINNGGWVDIFAVVDYDGSHRVLKTMRYRHDFTDRNFDRYRRDALAMERLTASPEILTMFGHCGVTAIVDYADGGDIADYVEGVAGRRKEAGRGGWSSGDQDELLREKLRIGAQVMNSIAVTHGFEADDRVSLSHTDISPYQFIRLRDGRFVLNDFNRARFISRDRETDRQCEFEVGNNPGKWRSPEEYRYAGETEKIDVYSAGNVLYYLLTEEKPFDDEEDKDVKREVMEGTRPKLPEMWTDPAANPTVKHPAAVGLIRAMEWCWTHDPELRPSAREVSDYLEKELQKLEFSPSQLKDQ